MYTHDRLLALRTEIETDPAEMGYAAIPEDPADAGARHAAIAALMSARTRPGAALAVAEPDAAIAAFAPDEWAAAKALPDSVVQYWFDRLMARSQPLRVGPGSTLQQGLAFLVGKGVLSEDRKIAIVSALSRGAPPISRFAELGLPEATASDIADALLRT